jgi:hypothetical protein
MNKFISYKLLVGALIFYHNVIFSQAINLGSAENFVVFTGDGAISNTGNSNILGNIGTNIGVISGLATSTVTGTIYNHDSTTNQAKLDLVISYNHLISIPATNLIHTPAFGNGETLPPGIYSIAAAGSVGGHLILDAIEDTNAVFIFRFGGAFTIGAAAIITLINGAKACNVYWVSEGALAIDAAAFVKGNFICNAGAISFGTSSELEGRLLSISGAIDFGPTHLNLPLFCTSYYIGSNYVFNKCIVCTTPDFIMYSGGGAITNTGNAIFNGNVGSDAGMISGFGTSTITGAFYNADGITARTKIDLQNAYNYLTAIPATNTTHTPAFGSFETLTPGVYSIGGAGSVIGDLTLDAQGDTNAIFIFKFIGALTTAASSKLILINGAKSYLIFWIAEGAISLATSTKFKGCLISHNGAISLVNDCNLEGRILSMAGAINVASFYGQLGSGCRNVACVGNSPLPIELISFDAECEKQNIILTWTTATETNNNYYSIERSLDGIDWINIAKINGTGTSVNKRFYSFIDLNNSFEISYYRLKQTDFDENFKYSTILDVINCSDDISELSIYPNPANEVLNISLKHLEEKIESIIIYNLLGEIIYYSKVFQPKIVLEDKINGIYYLHIKFNSKTIIKKFMNLN